jgi:hypothetical protein
MNCATARGRASQLSGLRDAPLLSRRGDILISDLVMDEQRRRRASNLAPHGTLRKLPAGAVEVQPEFFPTSL